jgi:hypothetical protein
MIRKEEVLCMIPKKYQQTKSVWDPEKIDKVRGRLVCQREMAVHIIIGMAL